MNIVVTIGRQFGSGGREVGKRLADALSWNFYDNELVTLAAKKEGLDIETMSQIDEKATGSLLYSLVTGSNMNTFASPYNMSLNDRFFIAQAEEIKKLAAKESCVIVGRCADYVLKDEDCKCINVFLYADAEYKIARVSRLYQLERNAARQKIIKTEKQRRTFYNYYTDKDWGKMAGYDLCIDTSKIGIERAVELIKDCVCDAQK